MQPGEVANRILSVGSTTRAILVAEALDSQHTLFQLESGRGFLTITGKALLCSGIAAQPWPDQMFPQIERQAALPYLVLDA